MTLLTRKRTLLAKIESSYGVDSTPTGAANAMLVQNMEITPLTVESQARDLIRTYIGNSQDIVGAFYGSISFEVEVAGAGAAGTAPKYGPLLRACGLAEVINAGVSVVYTPVSTGFESVVQYFNIDGVLHKLLGGRGTLSLKCANRQVPKFVFNLMGLFVTPTDTAAPTPDYSGYILPLAFNKANTPTFTLHGISGTVLRTLSIDLGNKVSYRNLVNSEAVLLTDRNAAGNIEIEATTIATKNWWTAARDASTGAMQLVHGTVAGNIVQIDAPAVQITAPTYGDFEGGAMMNAGIKLNPSSGNDELTITIK